MAKRDTYGCDVVMSKQCKWEITIGNYRTVEEKKKKTKKGEYVHNFTLL